MAQPTLGYFDSYLVTYVDLETEDRAKAIIADLGTFSVEWTDRLTVLQVYIIVCLEKQAEAEDLFAIKLKSYRAEFNLALQQARVENAQSGEYGMFSVSLLRA